MKISAPGHLCLTLNTSRFLDAEDKVQVPSQLPWSCRPGVPEGLSFKLNPKIPISHCGLLIFSPLLRFCGIYGKKHSSHWDSFFSDCSIPKSSTWSQLIPPPPTKTPVVVMFVIERRSVASAWCLLFWKYTRSSIDIHVLAAEQFYAV